MRVLTSTLVLAALFLATSATADIRVNDRSTDPPGLIQSSPTVGHTYSAAAGNEVAVLWYEASGSNTNRFRYAVSALSPLSFVQHGSPPDPPGFHWYIDPILRTPPPSLTSDGTFYIAGTIVSPVSPRHSGLGFLRGHATTPSSVTFDTPQVLVDYGAIPGATAYFLVMDMQVHPVSSVVYIVYNPSLVGGPPRDLYYVSSADGVNWSAPNALLADSLHLGGPPRILCGRNAGDVTFFWEETDNATHGPTVIKCRTSADGGVTLGSPTTVMSYPNWPQSVPGGDLSTALGLSVAIDKSGGPWDGSMLFGATIPMDLGADAYPSLATSPSQVEVEPDGFAATATLFGPIGTVLRGAISTASPPDTDYFAIDLFAGQTLSVMCDSMDVSLQYLSLTWVGPDGRSVLTYAGPDPSTRIGFAAPAAGRYFLRAAGLNPLTGNYRLRTTSSATPYPSAFDQHDVALSLSNAAPLWTGAQVITPGDPVGADAGGIALAGNQDGAWYATYNAYDAIPGRAVSRRVIRRSTDGGATWSSPATISGANTDWAQVYNTSSLLAQGQWCDTQSDGPHLLTVWTDGRDGDSDIYLDYIHRAIVNNDASEFTVSGQPGEFMTAYRMLTNLDHAQPFGIRMEAHDVPASAWSLPISSGTLQPGETQAVIYLFTIPADAAPGHVPIEITYRSDTAPYLPYASATLDLLVLGAADAGAPMARLELSPVAPNPLRGPGTVAYSLSRSGPVSIHVYGIDGRRVRTLFSGLQAAGAHTARWDALDTAGQPVAPGAYFVVMHAEGRTLTRRAVVLR